VFILKEVKVVCFDALLQVLILDDLHGTKIMQRAVRERQPHLSTEKDRNAILEAATKVRSEEWNPSHNALKARKSLEVADSRWERHRGTPHPGVFEKEAPSC